MLEFEQNWWGNCANTFGEELKQTVYATHMGLSAANINGKWPVYDLAGRTVVDIGGGPVSMLLKCVNLGQSLVIDPCKYPLWVANRYAAVGISYKQSPAELNYSVNCIFDEAWIYNVLQHVMSPGIVIKNAKRWSKKIRIFEWINIPPHEGHPNKLTRPDLERWLKGRGSVTNLNTQGCVGTAFYGVF